MSCIKMTEVDASELGLVSGELKEHLEVFGLLFRQRKHFDEYNVVNKNINTNITLDDIVMLSSYITITVKDGIVYLIG